MYGLAGERQLPECEVPWLAGYEGSRPVRIGNAAHCAVSARCLWRNRGRLPCRAPLRHRARRRIAGGSGEGAARPSRIDLGATGRGDLGGARPAPPLHPFQSHGLGRLRPRDQGGRAIRAGGPDRALAGAARHDPRGGLPARVQLRTQRLCPILRRPRRSTPLS